MRHAALGEAKRLRPFLRGGVRRPVRRGDRGRAADRGGARMRALLLAGARRSAGHGRRRPAPRQAHGAQGLRRMDRHSGRRRACSPWPSRCWRPRKRMPTLPCGPSWSPALAEAAGAGGMVGGQCLDLEFDKLGPPARPSEAARRAAAGHEDRRADPLRLRGRRHPRPAPRRAAPGARPLRREPGRGLPDRRRSARHARRCRR